MITDEQFKRAKWIESDLKEIEDVIEEFTRGNVRTSIGLISKYDHGSIGKNDRDARFNHVQKDLVAKLNKCALDDLRSQADLLRIQLAEHVSQA